MDFKHIPLLRHFSFFASVLKATTMLAGLFLFPLMVLWRACALLQARPGPERWYFALQTLAWGCAADAYCLPMLAMLANLCGYPAIVDGRGWLYLFSLLSDTTGVDLLMGEIVLQAGLSAVAFILSWCIGTESANDHFFPRSYLRKKYDA